MSSFEQAQTRRSRLKRAVIPDPGPIRTLTKATLANTVGNGLYMTISVIFFTRSVGLSNHQVALGLSIAAAGGVLVNIPAGHLADRRGPRGLAALLLLLEGVAMAAFAIVHSFDQFLIVSIAGAMCNSAGSSIRLAIMARFGVGEERVRIRAFQRAVTNFGISVGTVFAGLALALDTRSAYVAMVLANALTFVIAAIYVTRLPEMPVIDVVRTEGNTRLLVVFRDRRYLTASLLNGLFWTHFAIQSVGLPLWIVQRTSAPRWWVALLLLVNTTMVVLLQVRFSKGTGDIVVAARAFRRSGLWIALACVLYASAEGASPVVASIVLLTGMVVHTLGELLSSSASWGIGFGMAREDLQGQYQGAFSMGRGLIGIFAPLVVISVAVSRGLVGWLALGAAFVVMGAAFPPLARSYLREYERAETNHGGGAGD
ncbi:MAG TPA: MFS transporter [Acidimicrobiales bacterium]|nr:MFS transporter [Acidimicrobiales bacterium]